MEKAYDPKVLLEILKDQGLEVAEESSKILIAAVFDWLEQSAVASENKIDDIFLAVYPLAKSWSLEQAEKINKEDNE